MIDDDSADIHISAKPVMPVKPVKASHYNLPFPVILLP